MSDINEGDYLIVLEDKSHPNLKGSLVKAISVDYNSMYPIFVVSTTGYMHNSYLASEVRLASKEDDPEYFI
jgi:hypothetical protein